MTLDLASMWALGIFGILATIWVYWRQVQKLRLVVYPLTLNLIDLESEPKKHVKDKLKVLWGDREIHKLDITEIQISNTSKAISKDDIIEPLIISFGDAEILDASIMQKKPDNLDIGLSVEQSKIIVMMSLINKGESLTLKVISNNLQNPSKIIANARIKNGLVINRHLTYKKKQWLQIVLDTWDALIGVLVIPVGFFVFFWFFGGGSSMQWQWDKILDFIVFTFKLIFTVLASGFLFLIIFGYLPRWWFFERKK